VEIELTSNTFSKSFERWTDSDREYVTSSITVGKSSYHHLSDEFVASVATRPALISPDASSDGKEKVKLLETFWRPETLSTVVDFAGFLGNRYFRALK
jgi:hypothetical protein